MTFDDDAPPDPRPEVMRLAMLTEDLDAMTSTRRFAVHQIGRRGGSLLFFGLLDAIYAFSLINPTSFDKLSPSLKYLAGIAPLEVFGVLWAVAAALCFVNAFRTNDKTGFAAAIAIKVLWGLLYIGALFVGVPRSYVSVTLWLCLAGFVGIIATWPEPTTVPASPTEVERLARELGRLREEFTRQREELRRQEDELDRQQHESDPAPEGGD